MQAAIREHYGPPDRIQIREVPAPTPGAGQVAIRVRATTVNRTDCANLTARPALMRLVLGLRKPRRQTLGTDFAGDVTARGEGATKFPLGSRVFGFVDTGVGSQAEYMTIDEEGAFPIPEGVDYPTAAASLEGAHYAYSFLQRAGVKDGQRILVNGGTGAIGSALLQFARRYAVHLSVTCPGNQRERMRELGADVAVDYRQRDIFAEPGTYDRIFDAVGKSTFGRAAPLLVKGGVYISSELGPYAQNVYYALTTRKTKKRVIFPIPLPTQESVPFIAQRLVEGTFTPLIDRSYPFDRVREAYSYVLRGEKIGNVVQLPPTP